MNAKVQQVGKAVQGFLAEVGDAFRKVTWPDRKELVESTGVVVTFIVILAAVVLACDKVIAAVLRAIHA